MSHIDLDRVGNVVERNRAQLGRLTDWRRRFVAIRDSDDPSDVKLAQLLDIEVEITAHSLAEHQRIFDIQSDLYMSALDAEAALLKLADAEKKDRIEG